MPKTNKKEQPECKPSTSAFFIDEKTTEPLLKVAPNIDGREGKDGSPDKSGGKFFNSL